MKVITSLPLLILLLLFVLLGIVAPPPAKGQIFLEPVPNSITGLPDTVDMGDTVDFAYRMVNQGPLPFIGIQYTHLQVNGNLISLPIDSSLISLLGIGDTNDHDSQLYLHHCPPPRRRKCDGDLAHRDGGRATN